MDIVEASPIIEKTARLSEEAADNIMPFSNGEFEISLEENCGE